MSDVSDIRYQAAAGVAEKDTRIAALESELTTLRTANAEIREALVPFAEWADHLEATGSRRLADSEWPDIYGAPNMGQLRKARAALNR